MAKPRNLVDEDAHLQDLIDELADDSEMFDEPEQAKPARLQLTMKTGETEEEAKARAALTPEYHAVQSIFQLNQITASKEADLTQLADRLNHQTQLLRDGDLDPAESMLASQAFTLDALFHNLLLRSAMNVRNEFYVVEKLMKLALKAQSQCRTTLDSFASMKKPSAELFKQTNIALGPQQVNNSISAEKGKPPNELLERKEHEQWLDRGAKEEAVRVDKDLETVGASDRAEND